FPNSEKDPVVNFGLRNSDLFRPSDFGFRILDLGRAALCILFPSFGPFPALQPKINRAFDSFWAERHPYNSTLAGGLIAGIKDFLHEPSVFTRSLWRILAAHTTGKMMHFLRKAVVPQLFENRPGPAFGRGRFLYRITIAVFTVGRQRVAHVQ